MKYVLYMLSITIITMALMYIGIIKERNLPIELFNKLYKKCARKVLKYLEKNDSITIPEIRNLIQNETVSVIWSKKRLGITDANSFVRNLIDNLLKEEKIERVKGKVNSYKLKK
ncbi:MAG: hypothetical protein GX272_06410 [Epulopiscium sp.]|nr:hypothetical protein [Candidatus Epulonipiscium sp.]